MSYFFQDFEREYRVQPLDRNSVQNRQVSEIRYKQNDHLLHSIYMQRNGFFNLSYESMCFYCSVFLHCDNDDDITVAASIVSNRNSMKILYLYIRITLISIKITMVSNTIGCNYILINIHFYK